MTRFVARSADGREMNVRMELPLTRTVKNRKQRSQKHGGSWGTGRVNQSGLRSLDAANGGITAAPETNSLLTISHGNASVPQHLPIGQLLDLYRRIRTVEDREEFVELAAAALKDHVCSTSRCLHPKLARLVALVVDGLAIEGGVTPWLPDPRHQVPGGAFAGRRQR